MSDVVNIYEPLTLAKARAIGQRSVGQIQFGCRFAVPRKTLALLDTHVLAKHPKACLRETLNGFGAFDDLAFLTDLPSLRVLKISGNHPLDLTPIAVHGAITNLRAGSIGERVGERGSREQARGPCVDLLGGGRRNALFDVSVHRIAEALPQQAQQHLLDALLAPLFKDLLSGGHDGVLGFGSEIALEKTLQRPGSDVLVDFENIAPGVPRVRRPSTGRGSGGSPRASAHT